MSTDLDHEAIHLWFGLTYANYLVVPRSVLQSMPDEWQKRFVLLLEEMHEAFGHLNWPPYNVQALAREPELIYEPCGECGGDGGAREGAGEDEHEDEHDCPSCGGTGESDEQRYETPREVGIVADPIPHYNRGRTRLEPRGGD